MDPAKHAVLTSLHAQIATLCDKLLARIADDDASVFYPPEHAKTPTTGYFAGERTLLQNLLAEVDGKSALSKLVADAAGRILFSLFTMLDGVAEPTPPYAGVWYGLNLKEPGPSDGFDGMDLHDAFLETYGNYIEQRI